MFDDLMKMFTEIQEKRKKVEKDADIDKVKNDDSSYTEALEKFLLLIEEASPSKLKEAVKISIKGLKKKNLEELEIIALDVSNKILINIFSSDFQIRDDQMLEVSVEHTPISAPYDEDYFISIINRHLEKAGLVIDKRSQFYSSNKTYEKITVKYTELN